ncbi:MAG: methyltransferase domain-containing protein [Phycisphaeraceae bacterium]|nr:methyltransferase domain-containing protein [Phycisphaeraceae bacterium]
MAETRSGGEYVHGTHRSEQERLTLMNEILNARTLAEVRVRPGERILDVGSGLGQMSIAMAKAAGAGGRVLGIERSREQIARAQAARHAAGLEETQVEFRAGDALRLSLRDDECGSFDLAFTRFLLEHVPHPLGVVERMVRAVRPGGRIVLCDDDHEILRLHPEPAGLREVWRAYMALYDRVGNDPMVGRRLVQLLHEAGAKPARNTWVWFGACSGEPMFGPTVVNMMEILRGAGERMISERLTTATELNSCIEELRAFATRPDAAVWFAMALAEGIRPG